MTDNEYVAVKQFLALVGPDTDQLKSELINRLSCDESQRTITIKNNYYRANIGIQQFSEMKQVVEAAAHEKNFPAILIQYTGDSELAQYEECTNALNCDVKLISVESEEQQELPELEEWACSKGFEVVYLKPSEEQIETSKDLNEQYGIDRIVEALHLCDWPVRHIQVKDTGNPNIDRILQYINQVDSDTGSNDDVSLTGNAADRLWAEFCDMRQLAKLRQATIENSHSQTPEPQHAERVHLSPDSPSGTDTTTHDDVSITVEFELASPSEFQQEQTNVVDDTTREIKSVDVEEVVPSVASKKRRKKNKSKKPQNESGTL